MDSQGVHLHPDGGGKMRPKSIAAILLAVLVVSTGWGSTALAARTSTFAPIDPGVRASAMGGAFTAVGGEPIAMYWNPASLFFMEGREVEASYSDLYGLGLAKRTFFTFGLKSVYENPRFSGDKVVVTRDATTGPAYAFGVQSLFIDLDGGGYSELSLGGAAAWGYGDRLAAGVSFRGLFVSSDFQDVSASGYNLGMGLAWRYSEKERLAVAVPQLLSRVFWKFHSTERLPVAVVAGWSRTFGDAVTVSAESEWRENEAGPYRLAVGGEAWVFPDRLALRAGYRRLNGGIEDVSKPTFGAAVRFSRMRFDYAFRLGPDNLGDTHRLGLLVGF